MLKRIAVSICLMSALFLVMASVSCAVEKETTGEKVKGFWQRLFNYPANVTKESSAVVTDTGKRGTEVVTKEVKRVGQVTSGEVQKTKELITEPIQGTAETTYKAVEGTVKVPVEAAKEEPAETAGK